MPGHAVAGRKTAGSIAGAGGIGSTCRAIGAWCRIASDDHAGAEDVRGGISGESASGTLSAAPWGNSAATLTQRRKGAKEGSDCFKNGTRREFYIKMENS